MSFRAITGFASLICSGALMMAPAQSHASDASLPDILDVTGGVDRAKACAYPSIVLLNTYVDNNPRKRASCTGTLIHPRVVLFAAHCGVVTQLVFTENRETQGRRTLTSDNIVKQKVHPRYRRVGDQHIDWAYVLLKEPVTDVPLIPMASGCERPMLQKRGAEVYFSGFSPNDSKVKSMTRLRWARTSIRGLNSGSIEAGANGVTACGGDSGGPLLARVPDGSWRTIGIASTLANGCGNRSAYNTYSRVGDSMTAWVEKETGIDVTPCADENGQPTPSLECDKFMAYSESPDAPTGTRANSCSEAKTLPVKDTCEVPDSGEGEDSEGEDTEGEGEDTGETGDTEGRDTEGEGEDTGTSGTEGDDTDDTGSEDDTGSSEGGDGEDTEGDDTGTDGDDDSGDDDTDPDEGDEDTGDSDDDDDDSDDDDDDDSDDDDDDDSDDDDEEDNGQDTVSSGRCSVGEGSPSPFMLMGGFALLGWFRRRR